MYSTKNFTRRIEINLDDIKNNVVNIKASLKSNTRLMAVVKGDAYGCGAVECARAAVEAGCDMLGVTTLEEALELRQGGIDAPTLVFTPLINDECDVYIKFKITPTIIDINVLEFFAQRVTGEFPFHLKIETGMGRLGLKPGEVEHFAKALQGLPNLMLEGIYTHFAKPSDPKYVNYQIENTQKAAQVCHKFGFEGFIIHTSASVAFLKYPQYHFDMVRIGTLIYGQAPAGTNSNISLKDPWSCKARILQIKHIAAGESVGYGRDFVAKKALKIAIIPIGLADGFSLDPPLKAKSFIDLLKIIVKEILKFLGRPINVSGVVSYRGKNLEIIGRIGMQLLAVNVTNFPDLSEQQEVEIGIRRTSASSRLARLYFADSKIVSVRTIANQAFEEIYVYGGDEL